MSISPGVESICSKSSLAFPNRIIGASSSCGGVEDKDATEVGKRGIASRVMLSSESERLGRRKEGSSSDLEARIEQLRTYGIENGASGCTGLDSNESVRQVKAAVFD